MVQIQKSNYRNKKDVKTAAEIANGAIKVAVKAQNTITEAVKQGVEDRKKAINDMQRIRRSH